MAIKFTGKKVLCKNFQVYFSLYAYIDIALLEAARWHRPTTYTQKKSLKVHLVLLIPLNLVLDHYTAQFDIYKFYNKLTKKQKHKMHHQYHLQFCTNRYQQFKTRGNIILIYLQWT
jgi:hypothetical protein